MAQSTSTRAEAILRSNPVTGRIASLPTFASFSERNFRWFYLAMLGQMAAMNIQLVMRGYVVFEITDSFAALGGIALASALPMLFLGVFGGVLADRAPKKVVLQVGQFVSVLNALVVGILILTDAIVLWHLFAAGALQGITMALMMPARQAMIPEVVGRDLLMNAVALNSAGMNLMRVLAPAGAGLLTWAAGGGVIGAGPVYMVMAAFYLSAMITLAPLPRSEAASEGSAKGGLGDLRDGFSYVRRDPTILAVLGVTLISAFLAMPYIQLLPGFVKEVLGGGPVELGLLTAISGGGALFGALVIASLPERRRGLLLLLSAILLGVSLVVLSGSQAFWFAVIAIVFVGVGTAGRQAFSQILLHSYVENEFRGRVMALMMLQPGMMALGAFVIGVVAERAGIDIAMASLAVALAVVAGLLVVVSPRLRQLQ
ncbi:MAG: MFS transporter [Chloroflexi bacterium]|nr:MFS transporter [Chloroflexota bacterium]